MSAPPGGKECFALMQSVTKKKTSLSAIMNNDNTVGYLFAAE